MLLKKGRYHRSKPLLPEAIGGDFGPTIFMICSVQVEGVIALREYFEPGFCAF